MGGRDIDATTSNTDNEISLSIEETNKLRASLGLPLLKTTAPASKAEHEEHRKRKREEDDAANAAQLEERVRAAKERRKQQQLLAATKTLGEEDPEVDDVMAWVNKTRQQPRPSSKKKKSETDDTTPPPSDLDAKNLAGIKVKVGIDDLEAGEELILTLEDQGILDDKGRLLEDDGDGDGAGAGGIVLENVLHRENKQRAKAFRDAHKTAKPLWEEDGQRRSLLDKYEEEEEEAVLELDEGGELEAVKLKRQDDIRAKLQVSRQSLEQGAMGDRGGGDYFTQEEMAAMQPKPKKKKKERKLKKKALTADDLDELERNNNDTNGEHLGSRKDREERAEAQRAAIVDADQERRSRFDAALTKANIKSVGLKHDNAYGGGGGGGRGGYAEEEDEDLDLYRSMKKTREFIEKAKNATSHTASHIGPEAIADQLIAKRRLEEERQREQLKALARGGGGGGGRGGLVFTDIGEFTRGITVKEDRGGDVHGSGDAAGTGEEEVKEKEDIHVPMDEDVEEKNVYKKEEEEVVKEEEKVAGDGGAQLGNWAPASEQQQQQQPNGGGNALKKRYRRRAVDGEEEEQGAATTQPRIKQEEGGEDGDAETSNITHERNIGSGLGAALALLKERGELKQPVEWAGRMNDSRNPYFTKAMGKYEDVFTGGRTDNKLASDVETALTKKDQYGRILTPKEAFRQLCHDFHGIKPSKSTIEKRNRQVVKELAQRKAAVGAVAEGTLGGLKAIQEATATPFMVLSGTVKPWRCRDVGRSLEGGSGAPAAAPASMKGGEKRGGRSTSMAPPPPRSVVQAQQQKKGKK